MKDEKEELTQLVRYSLGVMEKEYYQTCYEIHIWEHDVGFDFLDRPNAKMVKELPEEKQQILECNIDFFNKTYDYLEYKKVQLKFYKDSLFSLLKKLINNQVEITKKFINFIHYQLRVALASIGINTYEQFWPCVHGWWDMESRD